MSMDKTVQKLIAKEDTRQQNTLSLIASENYASLAVREALSSRFTNKYSEGYPHKRYYAGNGVVDELELLAQARALKLFKLSPAKWSVNVQPYSGSPANLAIYHALIPVGEKILSLKLSSGGHLTHGYPASVTGKLWKGVFYEAREDGHINMNEVERMAMTEKPKAIVAGYSAYPFVVDWKRFASIAKKCGALFVVDMSHTAGLVAGGAFSSPFPYADVVMTTTHKTLRGPRGAVIFSKKEYAERINKAVFPGLQGGPHNNQIAALAVALDEASKPAFRLYTKQVVKNACALAKSLADYGLTIVGGGTDSHLMLVDVRPLGLTGDVAENRLEKVGIVVNKNTIPHETLSPMAPSGIRLGVAAVTTRGMKEGDMPILAGAIVDALTEDPKRAARVVQVFTKKYPLV